MSTFLAITQTCFFLLLLFISHSFFIYFLPFPLQRALHNFNVISYYSNPLFLSLYCLLYLIYFCPLLFISYLRFLPLIPIRFYLSLFLSIFYLFYRSLFFPCASLLPFFYFPIIFNPLLIYFYYIHFILSIFSSHIILFIISPFILGLLIFPIFFLFF